MSYAVIELNDEAKAIIRDAQDFGPRILKRVARVMDLQNELTVGHIVERRASGPRSGLVVGVVTGRYRRSIRPAKAQIDGNAVVSSIGSNVRYAGVHEFGFQGTVQVRAHTRRFARFEGQQISLKDAKSIRGKLRKGLKTGTGQVKAHSRQMNVPAKAPIYHGIVDRLPRVSQVLSDGIVEEWQRRSS